MGLRFPTNTRKAAFMVGATMLCWTGVANAQSTPTEQSLESVLKAYAERSGTEILFDPTLVANTRVDTTRPYTSVEDILANTGLVAEQTQDGVYVIRRGVDGAQSEAAGPPGVVQGAVTDAVTGAGYAGAIVTFVEPNLTTTTDERGTYRFPPLPDGEYTVVVDYLGSVSEQRRVVLTNRRAAPANFSLNDTDGVIIVRANRSSLGRALNKQRAADNASTVVSSDLLGSFPAENAAEALRRVPGVSFERDGESGEGARVNVRGFNSEAINIQLNGVALNGVGIERGVDLTSIQSDNIANITIQKTLLPSQEANGTGGLIEIETRSGLDYGDFYLSMGGEYEFGGDQAFGDEYELNGTAAFKVTDTFGIVASVQRRKTDRLNINANFLSVDTPLLPAGFTSLSRVPESFNFPFDPEFPDRLGTGANYSLRDRDEENLTLSLNLAWDIADHTKLRVDTQRITNDTFTQTYLGTQSSFTTFTNFDVPELGGETRRRAYIRSFRPAINLTEQLQEDTTTVLSFRGDTVLGPWEFKYKVGYSKTLRDRERYAATYFTDTNTNVADLFDPSTIETATDSAGNERVVGGATGQVGDTIPVVSLSDIGQTFLNDPSNYFLAFTTFSEARTPTEEYVGEFSTRYNFTSSILDYLEAGTKLTFNERANSDDVLSNSNLTSSFSISRARRPGFVNTPLDTLLPGRFSEFDLGLIGADGLTTPFLPGGSARASFDSASNFLEDDPSTPQNEQLFVLDDNTGDPQFDSGALSPATTKEDRLALWVQGKATIGDFDIVGGVRYERLKTTGSQIFAPIIFTDGAGTEPRETFANAGIVQQVDVDVSQETYTPTIIANYRPNANSVFRFAYFRSTINPSILAISRPTQVIANLRNRTNTVTFREVNPDLEANVTDNFDLDFSYYFDGNPGLIRAAVFYKKVKNNFTSLITPVEPAGGELSQRFLEILAPIADARPDLVAINDETEFFSSRPINGEGGDIYGFEAEIIRQLDFLPSFLSNVTVLANVTYTTSDFPFLEPGITDEGDAVTLELDRPLTGQSEWSGTASLSYEDAGFSGRLIYSYQSVSASDYNEFNLNTITPEFDTLDLRMSYTWEPDGGSRIIVFFEGDNLLNGPTDADIRNGIGSQFGEGSPSFFFPDAVQFNGGRTFTVGARVTF